MRTKLGRVVALTTLGVSALLGASLTQTTTLAAPPVSEPSTPSTEPLDEAATPSAVPVAGDAVSSTTATTTTTAPPLVVEVPPAVAPPARGTQRQVTDTLPPPPTTTLPPIGALPANSGEGRRIVYSKSQQRVWVVEAEGNVAKTHLVSGRRTWNQPLPGTYSVFSRSSYTCNIKNPAICWRYMVRFTKGPEGDNIGFHEIPNKNGSPVQSVAQLGTALSGGCVRQATPDAVYIWNWAPVGTKVVVLG